MDNFARRRRTLLRAAEGFDSVVVTNPKNLFYLTDFWGGGIGVVKEEKTVLITSVMEERRATMSGKGVEILAMKSRPEQFERARRIAKGRVLTDEFEPNLGRASVDGGVFLGVRRRKDADELARIEKAGRKIEAIYRMLEGSIRPGRTERQVAADVMKLATEEGLSPLPGEGSLDPVIIGSGENGSFPHAELSDRKLRTGDLVVADIFFRHDGYCSDCTRTYGVSRVSRERRDAYQAVLEAQLEGVALAKRGASGRSVHEAVRSVLDEMKLAQYYTHGTGHGVGIDIHEWPSLGSSSKDRLRDGDVVTIEPGVYMPGKFGIRIEDTLAILGGTRNLYDYTKELLVVG